MPAVSPLSTSGASDAVVNLLHFKLFHHFQTSTSQTLLFAPDVWNHASQLGFQFEFLMNAVLCVAARHLAFLPPRDPTYPTAAASHLFRALSGFRLALSDDLTSSCLDAFILTSLLLQFDIWCSTDLLSPSAQGVVSYDPQKDQIFTFCSSLKQVFLRSIPVSSVQASVCMPYIRCSPMGTLAQAAQISNDTAAAFQELFSYCRPLAPEMLSKPFLYSQSTNEADMHAFSPRVPKTHDGLDPIEESYVSVLDCLCLIMAFLPESRPESLIEDKSPLLESLAIFIFSFPVMCRGPFTSMIQQSDPHVLLLLYHFYRAARILLPSGRYWWAYNRAILMETTLKEWLDKECIQQAGA
ncbi:Uu.00g075690.m01.CDS01 [Anthostomella pinea]|uniref:Uu.00g075690.m01.CDS01 n=1 Tax=Anthostomella pinea TaxID=933095 RepID=A0AAI8YP18_9PEZI|nr:Uu.00g075690.m01.CDS01 [Anthostomella pinea]